MKLKKAIIMGGLITGVYWIGKSVGAYAGAKAVLDKYADLIPEDSFTVSLLDKAGCKMSVTAAKGES